MMELVYYLESILVQLTQQMVSDSTMALGIQQQLLELKEMVTGIILLEHMMDLH